MTRVTEKVEVWTLMGATILAFTTKHGVELRHIQITHRRVEHYDDWIDEWFELSCEVPDHQELLPANGG